MGPGFRQDDPECEASDLAYLASPRSTEGVELARFRPVSGGGAMTYCTLANQAYGAPPDIKPSAIHCAGYPEPGWRKPTQTGRQCHDNEARSDLPRIAQARDGSAARKLCLHVAAQSGFLEARCAR